MDYKFYIENKDDLGNIVYSSHLLEDALEIQLRSLFFISKIVFTEPPQSIIAELFWDNTSIAKEEFIPDYEYYWCTSKECEQKQNYRVELKLNP